MILQIYFGIRYSELHLYSIKINYITKIGYYYVRIVNFSKRIDGTLN